MCFIICKKCGKITKETKEKYSAVNDSSRYNQDWCKCNKNNLITL